MPGVDHAGIATQIVVERQLKESEGKSRHDVGREAFLERLWSWKDENQGAIENQLRALGASVDWTRKRFTMDPDLNKAVRKVFTAAYREGRIYRGPRMIQWDPASQTALSDLEVKYVERHGKLWHLRYPLADGSGFVVVATTRPETMLGDTGVAVHPDDERYRHLLGRSLKLPLTDREIPVVADDFVDPKFGTGCVKLTPAHDPNDHAAGKRLGLASITVIGFDARMTAEAGPAYAGLDRFECRKKVVADLEALGLLEKIEPYTHQVSVSDRSGAVLEPLVSEQWFMKVDDGAKKALEAVRTGAIRFTPEHWGTVWEHWLTNIQDWVHLPAALVGGTASPPGPVPPAATSTWRRRPRPAAPPADRTASSRTRTPWTPGSARPCGPSASSAGPTGPPTWSATTPPPSSSRATTSSSSGWPAWSCPASPGPGKFPSGTCTSTPSSGTSMAPRCPSPRATSSTPWRPWPSTAPTPCASAWRSWPPRARTSPSARAAWRPPATSATSCGTPARFVQMSLGEDVTLDLEPELGEAEHWMIGRLRKGPGGDHPSHRGVPVPRGRGHPLPPHVGRLLRHLHRAGQGDPPAGHPRGAEGPPSSTSWTSSSGPLHPIVPYLTEEIHEAVMAGRLPAGEPELLAARSWPGDHPLLKVQGGDPGLVPHFQEVLSALLRLKAENGVDPGKKVAAFCTVLRLEPFTEAFKSIARLESITFQASDPGSPTRALAVVTGGVAALELAGLKDPLAERAKLEKERDKLVLELASAEARLADESFVTKAPGGGGRQDPHPAHREARPPRPDPRPARLIPAQLG